MPSQKVRHDWATFTFHCHLSVPKWNPTLCDSVECSTPGSSVLHYLPAFAQIHVHWDSDANNLTLCHPLLLLPSVFPSIRVFSNESALLIRWQSIGASASVLPVNVPLGLTDLISLQSKGLSRVFSSTTIGKHRLFGAQLSLWSSSLICIWLLEKP